MSPLRRGREEDIERAYDLLVERIEDGIHQSDLWKELGMSSKEGSRLIREMEERGLVRRERLIHDSRWTYKIYAKMKPLKIGLIEDVFCFNCEYENRCTAVSPSFLMKCKHLEEWGLRKYRDFLESTKGHVEKEQEVAEGEGEGALSPQVEEGGLQEQGDLQAPTDE
jgi:predicted DNA-binding transcriptional regulator